MYVEANQYMKDFKGQHLADQLTQLILIITGILAFLVGYMKQDILYTAGIMGTGAISTLLVHSSNNLTDCVDRCSALGIFSSESRKMVTCAVFYKVKLGKGVGYCCSAFENRC
jgi:hypothetical protein